MFAIAINKIIEKHEKSCKKIEKKNLIKSQRDLMSIIELSS